MRVLLIPALVLLVAAGAPAPVSGCAVYGARLAELPRPVPDGTLGRWVAVTDAALTGACR